MEMIDLDTISKFYRRTQVWLVYFYRTDDDDATKVKDEFNKLSETLYGVIRLGAIDCHEDEELCEEYLVFGTPTVMAFDPHYSDEG